MYNEELNILHHSDEAISVLGQFYETKIILYVEGNDDIPFWDNLFKKYAPSHFYEIDQTYGKERLQEISNGIIEGKISNVIVACDADYSDFLDKEPMSNPLIIQTYGHSIENTMFCIPMLANYISRLTTSAKDFNEEVIRWIGKLTEEAKDLIAVDILNERKNNEVRCQCLTKGFPRFSNGKGDLDKEKVFHYMYSVVKDIYNDEDIYTMREKLDNTDKEIYKLMQGHFLEGAVNEFLRNKAKCSLSRNAIYAEFSSCRVLCKEMCADIKYVKEKIENAVSHIMMTKKHTNCSASIK